ncbi:hypothetical protein ARALYDRAFT_921008 [Arabidopsis lyrata subsp. lyrata]|uniref:Uncharacterized protein n=1 Tax=Arabidopsis lyrata subsp. lyrata TaxID=81972 RepID=D7MY74_ARALL|nr:hypothetical protein ARALYDRAFT_921008 [Arabidopsis lyrata subsp. lyrata]
MKIEMESTNESLANAHEAACKSFFCAAMTSKRAMEDFALALDLMRSYWFLIYIMIDLHFGEKRQNT